MRPGPRRHGAGLSHAARAVQLAEGMGDNALCSALELQIAALRVAGDLGAARQAAARHLDAARRLADAYGLYFALRDALASHPPDTGC